MLFEICVLSSSENFAFDLLEFDESNVEEQSHTVPLLQSSPFLLN